MITATVTILSFVYTFGIAFLLGVGPKEYDAEWYKSLRKPSWSVPDLVFPIVFPIFYLCEGIALARILLKSDLVSSLIPLTLFLAATILSASWSRCFFAKKRCDIALLIFAIELVLNWLVVWLFWGVDWLSGLLMLPVSFWSLYAITVNFGFLKLNKRFWKSCGNFTF